MKRKIFFGILTALCVAAAILLVIIGVRRTAHSATVEGLDFLGDLTLEAYEAVPDEDGEEGQYTIYYRYIDPKYGEIVFSPSVDRLEYENFIFTREAAAQYEDLETAPKTTVRRYVYVYPTDTGYDAVFQDRYMSLTDVSELIDPTPAVSATYYYIVAGILLLGGAYMLFLALTDRKKGAA